jgi:hypothetical protein
MSPVSLYTYADLQYVYFAVELSGIVADLAYRVREGPVYQIFINAVK